MLGCRTSVTSQWTLTGRGKGAIGESLHQSPFSKIVANLLRIIKIGHRGRWNLSPIFHGHGWYIFNFHKNLSNCFFGESWHQSSFSKIVANLPRVIRIGHRGRRKWSSIFQSKQYAPKSYDQMKKESDLSDLSPKKFQKVLMKSEEMADIFLNLAYFIGNALNLKTLIKVSKVSWTSQLSYEILRSSFERKFDKANFISPKRTPPKSSHCLGLMGSS